MLNLFPIQFLALLAYFILRICIGSMFLVLARRHLLYRHELVSSLHPAAGYSAVMRIWLLIFTELLISGMFILGFLTQAAALLSLALTVAIFFSPRLRRHRSIPPRIFYALVLGISLSLFITGAGAFAFDLPI